jgi:hypothetical protein
MDMVSMGLRISAPGTQPTRVPTPVGWVPTALLLVHQDTQQKPPRNAVARRTSHPGTSCKGPCWSDPRSCLSKLQHLLRDAFYSDSTY